jgi:hypothetical protein
VLHPLQIFYKQNLEWPLLKLQRHILKFGGRIQQNQNLFLTKKEKLVDVIPATVIVNVKEESYTVNMKITFSKEWLERMSEIEEPSGILCISPELLSKLPEDVQQEILDGKHTFHPDGKSYYEKSLENGT